MSMVTPEYIPVVLPCLPSHPAVEVRLTRWDWRRMTLLQNFREKSIFRTQTET